MATLPNIPVPFQLDSNGGCRRHSHGSHEPRPQPGCISSPLLAPKLKDCIFDTPNPIQHDGDIWYEDRIATLHHGEAHDITDPPNWLSDNAMGTCLFLLSRILKCPENKIFMCDPYAAYEIWRSQHKSDNEEKVANVTDEIITRMTGMEFLFIPVSDGYQNQYDHGKQMEEKEAEVKSCMLDNDLSREQVLELIPGLNPHPDSGNEVLTTGAHWSLLIFDLRDPDLLHATYFDSWMDGGYEQNLPVKETMIDGIKNILFLNDQIRGPVARLVARGVPNQNRDIGCQGDGSGACGPFVWAMAKEFAQYIIDARKDKKERSIRIELPEGFKEKWNWNSKQTRKTMRSLVDREKRIRRHLNEGSDNWVAWKEKLTTVNT